MNTHLSRIVVHIVLHHSIILFICSGINIGGDTATTYGVKIANDASHNAFMDVRGDASNKITFRHKDNASGSVSSMLELSNESSLTGSGYGATVNGRVNASSYYVGQVDTRAPTNTGVYMGTDGNIGYFNINKGSGTGGFAFNTYNADGSLLKNNLNLKASGVVQAAYYGASENAADTESVAIGGFDASGNIVRNYAANARFRSIESRLTSAEAEVNGPVLTKVNEVINRLNGLNFFSQNIETIAAASSEPPAPTSFTLNWVVTNGFGWQFDSQTIPTAGIIPYVAGGYPSAAYTLPAGTYTYSAMSRNDSNDYQNVFLANNATSASIKIIGQVAPWTFNGPFTGTFTLASPTNVSARFDNNYYASDFKMTLTRTA